MAFLPRLYFPVALAVGMELVLPVELWTRLIAVLRLRVGERFKLFNGKDACDYTVKILEIVRKEVRIRVEAVNKIKAASPLKVHLGQSLTVGTKMDLILQKATELGVDEFTPLVSKYSKVKLVEERSQTRMKHWQNVAISASEQAFRSRMPELHGIVPLEEWLTTVKSEAKIILDPHEGESLECCLSPKIRAVAVLIGPESGFSEKELWLAKQTGFKAVTLGPRILRTETAALTLLSILQYKNGDLASGSG